MKNRYIRNIQTPHVDEIGQQKLHTAKVLVAGAGGLGSTVIANLAGLGVGHLGIIDKDIVEPSNLNRQFLHNIESLQKKKALCAKDWVNQYNPDIEAVAYDLELNEENFQKIVQNYDIIADCFDSFQSKFLLNKIALLTKKPLIHAGVSGWNGQVMTINPNGPCLECVFGQASNEDPPQGVTSPVVSAVASLQSVELLKVILGQGGSDGILHYDGWGSRLVRIKARKNAHCRCSML